MVKSDISRRTEIILLAAILILAGVLRMGWPGLTEFKTDEAHMMTLALDMIEGKSLALYGMGNSVGLPNFPMSVWLYALPLALWKHVYSATLFTGLINTLTVLGCWWLARRYWGTRAALAAALVYAASPWAVLYSRKIWAQNLLPPLVIGWAITAALAFIERRSRFILPHILLLAVAVQVHLSAIALAAATAILLLLFWRRVNWKLVLLGAGIASLTALPFALHLLQTGFDLNAALDTTRQFESGTDLTPFRYTGLLSLGREIHSLAGPESFGDYLATVPDISVMQWLWGALIVAGLGRMGWRAWRERGDRTAEAGLLVIVWLLAPPLFFTRHSTPVFPHYFITTYPAQYIAAGAAFGLLAQRLRWAGGLIMAASVAAQVWIWAALLAFVSTQATPGAAGTPLAMQLQAADLARTMMAEKSAAEILIAGTGESPDLDGFAAVYDMLLRAVPHRFVNANRSTLFPPRPAVVLIDGAFQASVERYRSQATVTHNVPLREGEGSLWVLGLPGAAPPAPDVPLQPAPLLANGVTLTGYDAPAIQDDGTAIWHIHWLAGPAAVTDYHFFNHLLDADGQRVSQADAAAFSARQWRAGDAIISRFILPWPSGRAGPFTMRTGMYAYPSLENVPVLDVAGNPQAGALEMKLP